MLKPVIIILFLIFFTASSFAAVTIANSKNDSTPMVRVVTIDRKIIIGQLQYANGDSIYILPGTRKESKRRIFYQQVALPYTDVISVRVKSYGWIPLFGLGLLGLAGLYLVIIGVIPVFNNGLGDANFFIYLSPLLIGGSIWELLKRKRYAIKGTKSRYDKFRLRLKK